MSGVKIQKIPMKNLSPKEMAELAFDRGVSRGSSSTANTLGRGGLKRGAYGQGVGKMNKGGAVKYNEGGNVISDADANRLRKILPSESGKTISDADAKRLRKILPSESGKSISDADFKKLKKYEDGGEVRGMGRAYQGKKRGCKIR